MIIPFLILDSQGSYRSPCIDCDEYDENCCECREEAMLEAQSRRQAAAAEKQQRETWARLVTVMLNALCKA